MRSTLFAITPSERAMFFPDPLVDELRSVCVPLVECDSTAVSAERWRETLERARPEVIVAGWNAPMLPPDAVSLTGDRLKYLCCVTGSVRHLVDQDHLEAGMLVSNWGPTAAPTVAEAALMMILAALRRVNAWYPLMQIERGWRTGGEPFCSLFERRVGIHGIGNIARQLVRLLQPFGVQITAYSEGVPDAVFADAGVRQAPSLAALFESNDVIVEAEALIPATTGIVTASLLRRIPRGGVFVNVGRGAVVNERDLAAVAAEGRIEVALDVFEEEPLAADSPLRGLPNVLLMPHVAGLTTDMMHHAGRFAIANLRRYFAGEPIEAHITPEVFARST